MNKTRQLAVWMLKTRVFKTSDILSWGVQNYNNRAMRTARRLRELGLLRRTSLPGREDGYETNIEEMENYLRVT